MTRCLITGCGGFIGSHLADFLLARGFSVCGTVHRSSSNLDHLKGKLDTLECDMLDEESVKAAVAKTNPDLIFHLAAQSLVMPSWQDPEKTFKVNVLGTLHLLDSVRKAALDPVIEVICSSAEYGFGDGNSVLRKEADELCPASPYGVSKVTEDLLAQLYWRVHGMKIVRVRPFFVVGPRKGADVCADFARRIVEIEAGKENRLRVGNLETVRDFIDVRDAVTAMWLVAEKGNPGNVYNICSGQGHRIKDMLQGLLSMSRARVEICQDPDLMRPADEPVVVGDNARLRSLGWKQEIPIEKTLSDILDYWRENSGPTQRLKPAMPPRGNELAH